MDHGNDRSREMRWIIFHLEDGRGTYFLLPSPFNVCLPCCARVPRARAGLAGVFLQIQCDGRCKEGVYAGKDSNSISIHISS